MIVSFDDKDTEKVHNGIRVKRFDGIQDAAARKLAILDAATKLEELNTPGNRIEKLKGDRKGQHSIRINDQFRICFAWKGNDAYEVEIVDYH